MFIEKIVSKIENKLKQWADAEYAMWNECSVPEVELKGVDENGAYIIEINYKAQTVFISLAFNEVSSAHCYFTNNEKNIPDIRGKQIAVNRDGGFLFDPDNTKELTFFINAIVRNPLINPD